MASLVPNIFRQEVDDEIVFDLDTSFAPRKPRDTGQVVAETQGISPQGGFSIPTFDLGIERDDEKKRREQRDEVQKERETKEDSTFGVIDFTPIQLPQIDINAPDTQPVIDAIKEILEPVAETAEVVVEESRPVVEAIGELTEEAAKPVQEAVTQISDVIGTATQDLKIKQGTGSSYGQEAIEGTGVVVDYKDAADKAYEKFTQGTALEGTSGEDLYNLVNDPVRFVAEKGADFVKDTFTDKLGIDGTIIDFVADPVEFAATEGFSRVADLLNKPGLSDVAGALGTPIGSAVFKFLSTGDFDGIADALLGKLTAGAKIAKEAKVADKVASSFTRGLPGIGRGGF